MKIRFAFFVFLLFPSLVQANWGHRAGSDHFTDLPENSYIALEHSLVGGPHGNVAQYDDRFDYLEFDVHETFDGELVIFHDEYLKRMVPYSGLNKTVYDNLLSDENFRTRTGVKSYSSLEIKHLTLAELSEFHLKGFEDQPIPTLEGFMERSETLGLIKPMIIEIKELYTEAARAKLIEMAQNYLVNVAQNRQVVFTRSFDMDGPVTFLAFSNNFKGSYYPDDKTKKDYWCGVIKAAQLIGVLDTYFPWQSMQVIVITF